MGGSAGGTEGCTVSPTDEGQGRSRESSALFFPQLSAQPRPYDLTLTYRMPQVLDCHCITGKLFRSSGISLQITATISCFLARKGRKGKIQISELIRACSFLEYLQLDNLTSCSYNHRLITLQFFNRRLYLFESRCDGRDDNFYLSHLLRFIENRPSVKISDP